MTKARQILNPGLIAPVVVVFLAAAFLADYFPLELVLNPSTITGGDMPAHNYLASYLQGQLLPQGDLFGWAPGWWAGFPMFQFYMFLPYLLMALLGFLIPLEIAFKLVCAFSIILLPVSAFFALKWAGAKRPTPALGAVLMIPFLFADTHQIWGMNIYSMLCGEIANAAGLHFMLLFWGLFYRSIRETRPSIWCPILLALTIVTHPTTSIFALSCSLWAFVYLRRDNAGKWLKVCLLTFGLAFLLVAFWAIPLVFKLGFSVGFGEDWQIDLLRSFPKNSWIFAAGAIIALVSGIRQRRPVVWYSAFSLLVSLLLYNFGYHFNLVNIRFWGFIYLFLILLAAEGFGFLVERLKACYLVPFIPLIIGCYAFSSDRTVADEWVRWNFTGLEGKPGWKTYRNILDAVHRTRGRLAYDLHDDNNASFGSVRAFEAVPHFVEKDIIEGGTIQGGLSSLFTRHLQGEFSPTTAGMPRLVRAGRYDLETATRHLELYNVKHLVARHAELRKDLERSRDWRLLCNPGPDHALYELLTHEGKYVYIPAHFPIPVRSRAWKELAVDWFHYSANIEFPLVFTDRSPEGSSQVMPVQEEEEVRSFLFRKGGGCRSSVIHWLTLGPFPNPLDRGKDFWDPSSTDPFGKDEEWVPRARPMQGDRTLGKTWERRFGATEYVDLNRIYTNRPSALAYLCAYVMTDREGEVMLHYGSDDGIKIWLNAETLVENPGHRAWRRDEFSTPARLRKGENILILKSENAGGNWGFNLHITDMENRPIPDLSFRTDPERPHQADLKAVPTGPGNPSIISRERVSRNEIRFHTEGPGLPHIIKISYFPNWRVEGADRAYRVSPCFLLVYPTEKDVRLYYGLTPSDITGRVLTAAGLGILCVCGFITLRGRRRKGP